MLTRRLLLLSLAAALAPAAAAAEPGKPLKPFMLEDVNGTVVDLDTIAGKFVLMFFGYTSCPDICPTTLSTLSAALKQLDESERSRLLALFVTLDPQRDTAKVLSDYARAFDELIVPLRGPKAYVDSLAAQLGVTYTVTTPDPAKPDEYSVDHTASIFLIAPDNTYIHTYGHGIAADELAKSLREILKQAP